MQPDSLSLSHTLKALFESAHYTNNVCRTQMFTEVSGHILLTDICHQGLILLRLTLDQFIRQSSIHDQTLSISRINTFLRPSSRQTTCGVLEMLHNRPVLFVQHYTSQTAAAISSAVQDPRSRMIPVVCSSPAAALLRMDWDTEAALVLNSPVTSRCNWLWLSQSHRCVPGVICGHCLRVSGFSSVLFSCTAVWLLRSDLIWSGLVWHHLLQSVCPAGGYPWVITGTRREKLWVALRLHNHHCWAFP